MNSRPPVRCQARPVKAGAGAADTPGKRRPVIRRYQLQVFAPDWGGWHTVVTASSEEVLATSARLLGWQTGKRLRIVDPDGRVVRDIEPEAPDHAVAPAATS